MNRLWHPDARPSMRPGLMIVTLERFTPLDYARGALSDSRRAMPAAPPAYPRQSRPLQGDILCDESGQLYERVGQYVRRVHQITTGPDGEMRDVAPPAPWPPDHQPVPRDVRERGVIDAEIVDGRDAERTGQPRRPVHTGAEDARAEGPPVRVMLPAGTKRVVRIGDVRDLIAPQLADAARLRDMHRLPCFVQVVESTRTQPVSALAPPTPSGKPSTAAVTRLTPQLAAAFDVAALLRHGVEAPADEHVAARGERFLVVQIAADPTRAARQRAAQADAPAPAAPRPLRTAIPSAFLKPWEFVRTREEAEYDATVEWARGRIARWAATIRRWMAGRADATRWTLLLAGKTHDEQLWCVRPPRGGLVEPGVRAWAANLLMAAGYDVPVMLREWELFWRRKGI